MTKKGKWGVTSFLVTNLLFFYFLNAESEYNVEKNKNKKYFKSRQNNSFLIKTKKNKQKNNVNGFISGARKSDKGYLKVFGYNKKNRTDDGHIKQKKDIPDFMCYVKGGMFCYGPLTSNLVSKPMPYARARISDFYMDETEVSNLEYRKYLAILEERNNELNEYSSEEPPVFDINSSNLVFYTLKYNLEKQLDEEYIKNARPDMDVIKSGFENTMAEVYMSDYFDNESYNYYPVVGITYNQAVEFTKWRTLYMNEYRAENGLQMSPSFSLPSYAQWQYAAFGWIKTKCLYPWGSSYTTDKDGNLMANFKVSSGNYDTSAANNSYPTNVYKFRPNGWGIYDMGGNVAEYVIDSYDISFLDYGSRLDPVCKSDDKIKIVCGGSYLSSAAELQCGAIDTIPCDLARPDVGFRCILPVV